MEKENSQKRQPPHELYVTYDFIILYRISEHKNKTKTYYEIKYNFPKFLDKHQKARNKKSYGKRVSQKTFSVSVADPKDKKATEWEIFKNLWLNDNLRSAVKVEVISALKKEIINGISLLLFTYVFWNEITKDYDNNDKRTLISIVLNPIFRDLTLFASCTEYYLTDRIERYIKYKGTVTKKDLKYHLENILKHAQLNRVITTKLKVIIPKGSEIYDEDQLKLNEIRRALVCRSFSLKSEIKLIKWLENKIDKGETKFLGVLIKMFTGMSSAEVCALKWSDYEKIEYAKELYHLKVTKRMYDSSEIKHYEADQKHKYRLVPIPTKLDEFIKAQYKKLIDHKIREYRKTIRYELTTQKPFDLVNLLFDKLGREISYAEFKQISDGEFYRIYKNMIEEEIINYPIVARESDKFLKPIIISSMNQYGQEAIREGTLKTENELIIPNSNKKSDASKSRSDIFHTNYIFHTLEDCGLTPGELQYILGNETADTFSGHYCDFSNDFMQIKLAKKINLWVEELFAKKENEIPVPEFHIRHYAKDSRKQKTSIKAEKDKCVTANIFISSNQNCKTEITLESNHGIEGNILMINK